METVIVITITHRDDGKDDIKFEMNRPDFTPLKLRELFLKVADTLVVKPDNIQIKELQ